MPKNTDMMAIIDPGDEVVIFEPFYENYGPDAILSGATPRYVTLREPDWSFDPEELAAAFNEKTKAIILNTPNNPTGKVFTRDELETIAALCRKWDAIAISDEIYEHIIYDGEQHIPIATIEGMAAATATLAQDSDGKFTANERARNKAVRDFAMKWFADRGMKPADCQANFMFVNIGVPAKEFRDQCRAKNVLVARDFPPFEKTMARITLGTMEEMQKAVTVFGDVLGKKSTSAAA